MRAPPYYFSFYPESSLDFFFFILRWLSVVYFGYGVIYIVDKCMHHYFSYFLIPLLVVHSRSSFTIPHTVDSCIERYLKDSSSPSLPYEGSEHVDGEKEDMLEYCSEIRGYSSRQKEN